jgi:murein DD-endopeptidase MepM/ murein hydrolase activator NlpD
VTVADSSRVWPWLIAGAGAAIAGGMLLRRWSPFPDLFVIESTGAELVGEASEPTMWGAPPDVTGLGSVPAAGLPGQWVWPLPSFEGRRPVISDGWGSPRLDGARHRGVDIMYRRNDNLDAHRRPGTANGSKHHVMPDGVPVVAVHDGVVWSAGWTPRGFSVVIDHGRSIGATYYTHLERIAVRPTEKARGAQRVIAGQAIGAVGADPMDQRGLKHLHFAFWRGGPSDAIDPGPLMKTWRVLRAPLVPLLPQLPMLLPRTTTAAMAAPGRP